ncbi:JM129 [macacine gammaherpesvirus 11]|uniref:JM129 n=2 Tax=macacine gammaherpesvirus 11 TaxID=2560570 RepID=G9JMD7_9GAMA|nr:JM129 [Macaca fuscata rhadinovirus]AAT00106.1 JM129 [Macaca fuscata rhadinovirus]AEW87654.1 JM129 [Macaca fuscata rhadinovirus]AEW87824.1 JM129 [Macaca fuscata rhadinovirus]
MVPTACAPMRSSSEDISPAVLVARSRDSMLSSFCFHASTVVFPPFTLRGASSSSACFSTFTSSVFLADTSRSCRRWAMVLCFSTSLSSTFNCCVWFW